MDKNETKKLVDSIFSRHQNIFVTIPAQVLHALIMSTLTASTLDGISEETKMIYLELAAQVLYN